MSLTPSLTHLTLTPCRLVDLIDVALACEFVEVVTVADVDNEDRVGKKLLQI